MARIHNLHYAIVGHGRLGTLVEEVLKEKDEIITRIIDPIKHPEGPELNKQALADTDVAIIFTSPDAAYEATKKVLECGVNAVVGTTKFYQNPDGSLNQEMLQELGDLAKSENVRFLYAPNFSIGVNLFVSKLEQAAKGYEKAGYKPYIIEVHHTGKTADVSGTAINLIGKTLLEAYEDEEGLLFDINNAIWPDHFDLKLLKAPYDKSVKGEAADKIREQVEAAYSVYKIPIVSIRYGDIPGTHAVGFIGESDSNVDYNEVTDRKIFARDAHKATHEVMIRKPGIYNIRDIL